MALTKEQQQHLRRLAHELKPIVQVGKQGLTATVITSVDQALSTRELIKIKFGEHKDQSRAFAQAIATATHSELVSVIGHTAILYRAHPNTEKRKIELP